MSGLGCELRSGLMPMLVLQVSAHNEGFWMLGFGDFGFFLDESRDGWMARKGKRGGGGKHPLSVR